MLKDCVIARRKISFEGGEFELRGVSLPDISSAIMEHREAVDRVADILRSQAELNTNDFNSMVEILIDVIRESPYLAAFLICSCADEPDAYSAAFHLPLTVQIEALRAIGELTFSDAEALKKLIADVRGLLAGIRPPRPVDAAA
jgi:hypothetical protein